MLGADGKLVKELDQMIGDKVSRVFLQFVLSQPAHQLAQRYL